MLNLTINEKMLGLLWDRVLIPNKDIMENWIDSYGLNNLVNIETRKEGKTDIHIFGCSRMWKTLKVTL